MFHVEHLGFGGVFVVKAGVWVQIRANILEKGQRAVGIPENTAETPLVMWVKGYLLDDAEVGEVVSVRTVTGRVERGVLEVVEPVHVLGYGDFVPEILEIGERVREGIK
jgi:translation elongation factor EF-Tu-like GTPase